MGDKQNETKGPVRKLKKPLSQQLIDKIREMYEVKGYRATEIAGLLNIGTSTVYKYVSGLTPPQTRTTKGGLPSAEREVARQVEYDITKEAIKKTQDIYSIGHLMTNTVVPMAESYGTDPKKFIEICIDFWDEYHNSVYEWKRENEILRVLLNKILEDTEPQALEALRKKLIANQMFQLSIYLPMLGIKPTQEILLNCAGALKELI